MTRQGNSGARFFYVSRVDESKIEISAKWKSEHNLQVTLSQDTYNFSRTHQNNIYHDSLNPEQFENKNTKCIADCRFKSLWFLWALLEEAPPLLATIMSEIPGENTCSSVGTLIAHFLTPILSNAIVGEPALEYGTNSQNDLSPHGLASANPAIRPCSSTTFGFLMTSLSSVRLFNQTDVSD